MKGMLVGAMVFVGLMASGLKAQERPILQVGDSVRVSYPSGRFITGRVLSLTGDALVIRDKGHAEQAIEFETIKKVEVRGWQEPRRARKGQVVGATVGLLVGTLGATVLYCNEKGTDFIGMFHYCDARRPPRGLRFRYEFLALGAGLGWLIGRQLSSVEPRWGWIEGGVQQRLTINPTIGNGIGFSASIRTN